MPFQPVKLSGSWPLRTPITVEHLQAGKVIVMKLVPKKKYLLLPCYVQMVLGKSKILLQKLIQTLVKTFANHREDTNLPGK